MLNGLLCALAAATVIGLLAVWRQVQIRALVARWSDRRHVKSRQDAVVWAQHLVEDAIALRNQQQGGAGTASVQRALVSAAAWFVHLLIIGGLTTALLVANPDHMPNVAALTAISALLIVLYARMLFWIFEAVRRAEALTDINGTLKRSVIRAGRCLMDQGYGDETSINLIDGMCDLDRDQITVWIRSISEND